MWRGGLDLLERGNGLNTTGFTTLLYDGTDQYSTLELTGHRCITTIFQYSSCIGPFGYAKQLAHAYTAPLAQANNNQYFRL